jgi:hypothetical protein
LESPTALQLRLFQTMGEIAVNQNSTIILPVPIDLLRPYLNMANGSGDASQIAPEDRQRAEHLYEEAVGSASPEMAETQEPAGDPDGPADGQKIS